MNLNPKQVERLNILLKEEELKFPEFRREVSQSGHNFAWVKKALAKSGNGSPELRSLVGL